MRTTKPEADSTPTQMGRLIGCRGGHDADAYILKSIIYDWDDERSSTILKNCRQKP